MKLKLELFRYDTLVFGKILEQSKDIRRIPEADETLEICNINGFKIKSWNSPSLNENSLFIRGKMTSSDDLCFYYNYKSEEQAERMCEKIRKGVDEINMNSEEKESIEKIL